MDAYDLVESTAVSAQVHSLGIVRHQAVVRQEPPFTLQVVPTGVDQPTCDGVRQLAVVVWARTKLLERLLVDQVAVDSRVLAGLAEIGAAITAISERLDALEDSLPRQAA
ncbi:MAG: hypothetical protein QOF33_4345 [Thermomicrobiales bacterium]|nr:hypothetical protein [Thermomicrobiales bacterium]